MSTHMQQKGATMKTATYPVGTKLRLVRGTNLWGQAHVHGKSDAIYEVASIVDDGTSMERISLREVGETEIAFPGISPGLFEPV